MEKVMNTFYYIRTPHGVWNPHTETEFSGLKEAWALASHIKGATVWEYCRETRTDIQVDCFGESIA
jgi:hypothetical protein